MAFLEVRFIRPLPPQHSYDTSTPHFSQFHYKQKWKDKRKLKTSISLRMEKIGKGKEDWFHSIPKTTSVLLLFLLSMPELIELSSVDNGFEKDGDDVLYVCLSKLCSALFLHSSTDEFCKFFVGGRVLSYAELYILIHIYIAFNFPENNPKYHSFFFCPLLLLLHTLGTSFYLVWGPHIPCQDRIWAAESLPLCPKCGVPICEWSKECFEWVFASQLLAQWNNKLNAIYLVTEWDLFL